MTVVVQATLQVAADRRCGFIHPVTVCKTLSQSHHPAPFVRSLFGTHHDLTNAQRQVFFGLFFRFRPNSPIAHILWSQSPSTQSLAVSTCPSPGIQRITGCAKRRFRRIDSEANKEAGDDAEKLLTNGLCPRRAALFAHSAPQFRAGHSKNKSCAPRPVARIGRPEIVFVVS